MRPLGSALLCSLATTAAAEVHIHYDRSLEGLVERFETEEVVLDVRRAAAQLGALKNNLSLEERADDVSERGAAAAAALSSEGVLLLPQALSKRQQCEAGFGYCAST
ncbi:hypothetical protein AAL_01595 [Moelleriella libera RCEF 2490]|uniref:Uncharacterized protein n=1 Tax=Moelleriella libera RCEF 2490 TaxID=1081109 RepID=A0A166UAC0_9HYPO|nr:hypothetical protein AAL_01595 [Moelleriella libera RCEF 2490]